MNAYYSEVMFRSTSGNLNVPGVATENQNNEWVDIIPVRAEAVTAVAIDATELVGIIDVAAPLLTLDHVANIEKILAKVKAILQENQP